MEIGANVGRTDIERMIGKLYITSGPDRARKTSSFWVLLVLSAVIASAGVIADSTATVIGAMIVAPLMIPILGTALALVLTNRRHLVINVGLILAGALVVIAVGYLLAVFQPGPITAANNSQVAARVSPKLIDLTAALATGLVGAFALVRSDISDTLPGVAIAISLVPPLAVVGITLESGVPDQALGALLLFSTNVAAIIATGTLLLLAVKVSAVARQAGMAVGTLSGRTLVVVVGFVIAVAVPLGIGSLNVYRQQQILSKAQPVAESWAEQEGWRIVSVEFRQGILRIVSIGSLPEADPEKLRADLDAAGLGDVHAEVGLVLGGTKDLPVTAS
jgi:uncharacterized hydrophobic protein (TIGR00271 family)